MEDCFNICNLPDDCLITILQHCDIQSLGRVASSCKRLNNIVKNYESVWLLKSRTAVGSNMNSPIIVQRSKPALNSIQRCKVSQNWIYGDLEETYVLKYGQCMPWMCMERHHLYVSKGKKIVKLFRGPDGNINTKKKVYGSTLHDDDVSKFVINGREIFSVGWDGKLCRYKKSSLECMRSQLLHDAEVLGIDSKKDILVTGSRDETIKIWKISRNFKPVIKVGEFNTEARVLALSLLPSSRFLVAGLPGVGGIHPIPIYDIEMGNIYTKLGNEFKRGGGAIEIFPESENLILTCGYDTKVKLWDVRTPTNYVSHWVEPYDNIVYSVKSDYSYTVVSGGCRSGVFHVWDKRASRPIMSHHNRIYNCPVYSLQMDASHVFTALSRRVVQHCFLP